MAFQYQLAALDFIDKSLEGVEQARCGKYCLINLQKRYRVRVEDAFQIENARPYSGSFFMISCTLRRRYCS